MAGALALSKLATCGVKSRSLLAVVLLLAAAAMLVIVFNSLPIENAALAIDWKQIWVGTHAFSANYGTTELRTPPWALPVIWPLTMLPLGISWGLAAAATLAVLVLAVPRQETRGWLMGVLLLAGSYPALRQLIDGNLEALVIGGVLLMLAADRGKHPWLLAIGLLMAAAKIQETWLFFAIFCFHIWRTWQPAKIGKAGLSAFVVAAAFLVWRGGDWWQALVTFPWPGTAIDSSLSAFSARVSAGLVWILWPLVLITTFLVVRPGRRIEQLEAGVVVAAGLLLAPYAASNSVLTPLALTAPVLLLQRPLLGAGLLILADLPYLLLGNLAWRTGAESNYWTVMIFVIWLAGLWRIQQRETNPPAPK